MVPFLDARTGALIFWRRTWHLSYFFSFWAILNTFHPSIHAHLYCLLRQTLLTSCHYNLPFQWYYLLFQLSEYKHHTADRAVPWCYMHAESPLPHKGILRKMSTDESIDEMCRTSSTANDNKEMAAQWGTSVSRNGFHASSPFKVNYG